MKKLIVFSIGALFCFTNIFAQKIPASRDILPAVLEFANDSESFKESELQIADIANNEYVITGYKVQKHTVGYIRQDYTVAISRNETDFVVAVSDMTTIGSDQDGNALDTATMTSNTKKSTDRLAGIIKKDLAKRLISWGDQEYAEKLSKALTSPVIMSNISRQTALVFKKFISDNKIIGKPAEFQIYVSKVEAAGGEYANVISGKAFCGYKTGAGGIPKAEYVPVTVYTNNTTSDPVYTAKGTIKDVKRADKGGLASIEINE
jgi:hypothetical protein